MKPTDMQRKSSVGAETWFTSATLVGVHIDHKGGTRTATVDCPYCAGEHSHDWPMGKNYVGIVIAPCRDISNESAVAAVGLIRLLDYAANDQNRYQVLIPRGFGSDCAPLPYQQDRKG